MAFPSNCLISRHRNYEDVFGCMRNQRPRGHGIAAMTPQMPGRQTG
jgi:hypothetical protein